jgi:hypothetical protein
VDLEATAQSRSRIVGRWARKAEFLKFRPDGKVVNPASGEEFPYRLLSENLITFGESGLIEFGLIHDKMVIFGDGGLQSAVASQRVPEGVSDEAVLERVRKVAIQTNLRQIAAGAQQYMLDADQSSVTYPEIVGPGKYVETPEPVLGESYEGITLGWDTTRISVETAKGITVLYDF